MGPCKAHPLVNLAKVLGQEIDNFATDYDCAIDKQKIIDYRLVCSFDPCTWYKPESRRRGRTVSHFVSFESKWNWPQHKL